MLVDFGILLFEDLVRNKLINLRFKIVNLNIRRIEFDLTLSLSNLFYCVKECFAIFLKKVEIVWRVI